MYSLRLALDGSAPEELFSNSPGEGSILSYVQSGGGCSLFALRTRLTDRHNLDGIRLVVDLRADIRCLLQRSFSATWLVHRFVAAIGGNHSYLGVTRWRTQAAPHWYNAFERR